MDFCVLLGCFSFNSYSGLPLFKSGTPSLFSNSRSVVFLLSTLLVRSSHSILDYLEWRTGLVATVNPVSEGVSTRSLKQTGLSKDRDLSRAKMALSPLPGKISATGEAPGGRLLSHL